MNKIYERLYNNACDIADLIRDIAADAGVPQEQAAKAVEIAALMRIEQKLDNIDEAIINISVD